MRLRETLGFIAIAVGVAGAMLFVAAGDSHAQAGDAKVQAPAQNAVAATADKFIDPLQQPAMMSPLAEKRLLNGVALAGKRLVVAGSRGHILYSNDLGKTWIQCKVPMSITMTSIYFASAKKGWVTGQDGLVLHSSDGGVTWVKQLDGSDVCKLMDTYYKEHPLSGKRSKAEAEKTLAEIQFLVKQGNINPFLDVWFEDESNGFIVGAFNLILHTADGGKTWEPWLDRTENPMGMHLYCVRPVGKDLYISGEQGLLLKLDRKANHFKALKTPYVGTYFGITGKEGALVAYGMRGNIYRSKDGGANWQKIESGVKAGIMGGTTLADGTIVLVTQGGHVLLSKDGGMIFTKVKRDSGEGIPAQAVVAIDDKTIAIAGFMGVQIQKIQ